MRDLPDQGSTTSRGAAGPARLGDRPEEGEQPEELRICDEFLQQCEQAELLPDQRWVQLISLTRSSLEVEPLWWDRLRASTIVASGAAAVELGLQVARAVTS
jgi:hypothetical protein